MNVSQTLATQCLFLVQFKPLHPVGDQPCCLELLLLCWLGNWGSGTLSKPWCFPQAGCDNVCTLFVWTHPVPWDIFVLDQGSNHQPLLWKHSLNHWLAREVPAWLFFFFWRLITLQYCIGFAIYWHESTMGIHNVLIVAMLQPYI